VSHKIKTLMFANPEMKCIMNFTEAAKFSYQWHKFHFFIPIRFLISFMEGGTRMHI
jgi:hypothetical protein